MNGPLTEERETKIKNDGFAKWLEQPIVKLLMAGLPPLDPPETLLTLMRTAFDAGYGTGVASTMMDILTAMAARPRKPGGGA